MKGKTITYKYLAPKIWTGRRQTTHKDGHSEKTWKKLAVVTCQRKQRIDGPRESTPNHPAFPILMLMTLGSSPL